MSAGTMNGNGVDHGHEVSPGVELFQRPTFVESQAKGEVDTQIATAKRFPRSIKQFKERALSLATLDPDTAASCFYSLPRDGKTIEGPSARLAEIVAASWGNMRAQASIVSEDGEFIVAQGRCWDLENNVAVSTEVRRRITGRGNKRYSADMINTTANAACSIALRNAVFKVVPMAIVKPVYDQARKVAVGDAATLVDRRAKMISYFQKMGVRPEQVCAAVDCASVEDISIDDLATLLGLANAIKEGDTTVDEAFPAQTNGKGSAKSNEAEKKTATDSLAESIATEAGEESNDSPTDAETSQVPPQTDQAQEQESQEPLIDQLLKAVADTNKRVDVDFIEGRAKELNEEEAGLLIKACMEKREQIAAKRNGGKS